MVTISRNYLSTQKQPSCEKVVWFLGERSWEIKGGSQEWLQ